MQWQAGAIGNATWQGVALADIMAEAEVMPDAKYVWFEGGSNRKGGGIIPFGSIPIAKAIKTGSRASAGRPDERCHPDG